MNEHKKPNAYFKNTRSEMLSFIPHDAKKILEVGCGIGNFGASIKERQTAEVWGIEMDRTSAKKAETLLDHVLCGDAIELVKELPDNSFDCIVCNDILEHLVDPSDFLQQLKQKLTPSGHIVASIPNVRYFDNFINFVFKKQWKYELTGVLDETHFRFFTKKSLYDFFHKNNFEIKTIKGINGYTNSWKFRILIALTLGYLADTAPIQYACIVTKK